MEGFWQHKRVRAGIGVAICRAFCPQDDTDGLGTHFWGLYRGRTPPAYLWVRCHQCEQGDIALLFPFLPAEQGRMTSSPPAAPQQARACVHGPGCCLAARARAERATRSIWLSVN